jgi:asparagine synthase (glutamine-hydrolysing)
MMISNASVDTNPSSTYEARWSAMYRYVAFLRNEQSPHAELGARQLAHQFMEARPQWRSLQEDNGLFLFHLPPLGRPAAATLLHQGHGVILGTLFPKELNVSPRDWRPLFDEELTKELLRTKGRQLVNQFWGSYVAFLVTLGGATQYIVRDCSGMIPCYTIEHGGITIATSDIQDISGLPIQSFSINKRYLAGFIYEVDLSQRECALNEVKEVLAGECLEFKDGRSSHLTLWDPREVSRRPVLEDFETAARQVGDVTQACVDFWASKFDRIVHNLSGGLDSSAILGCLKRSPYCPAVTCVHLTSPGLGEDEHAYARVAADAAGVELILQPGFSDSSRYDERVYRVPRAPKPSVIHLGIAVESDTRELHPLQTSAEAIWDGQGGDHVFFESRSPIGAVDYAFRHGIGGDFAARLGDAARLSGLSYWGVMRKVVQFGLRHSTWQPEDEYRRPALFLNPELVQPDLTNYVWQPWVDGATDLPPGKRWQIGLLGYVIHRHRPFPELQYAAAHHPLFSQPLLELCLRIPTYTLLQGGINRALERAAFQDCVPERIIRRRSKGIISTSFMRKMRDSLPFIRDLLLDGVLVRERIVDRAALEPFLAGNRPLNNQALWPFLSCFAAEVWARKWAASAWRL